MLIKRQSYLTRVFATLFVSGLMAQTATAGNRARKLGTTDNGAGQVEPQQQQRHEVPAPNVLTEVPIDYYRIWVDRTVVAPRRLPAPTGRRRPISSLPGFQDDTEEPVEFTNEPPPNAIYVPAFRPSDIAAAGFSPRKDLPSRSYTPAVALFEALNAIELPKCQDPLDRQDAQDQDACDEIPNPAFRPDEPEWIDIPLFDDPK